MPPHTVVDITTSSALFSASFGWPQMFSTTSDSIASAASRYCASVAKDTFIERPPLPMNLLLFAFSCRCCDDLLHLLIRQDSQNNNTYSKNNKSPSCCHTGKVPGSRRRSFAGYIFVSIDG